MNQDIFYNPMDLWNKNITILMMMIMILTTIILAASVLEAFHSINIMMHYINVLVLY